MKRFFIFPILALMGLLGFSPIVDNPVSANSILPPALVNTFISITSGYGKCMDQATWNFQNGGNVHQYQCHGGYNQLWLLRYQGNNQYIIVNVYSGKCLDVAGYSTQNGANAQQWDCTWHNNQRWTFEYVGTNAIGSPTYRIRSVHSGKCLDVAGYSTANSANIQLWDCHSGANQKWSLFPGFH